VYHLFMMHSLTDSSAVCRQTFLLIRQWA